MKKDKFRGPATKTAIIIVIISLVILSIIGYIWKVLKNSEYFTIKDIITRNNNAVDLSYLKGRNIFRLDLDQESEYILKFSPDCRKVRIIRVLPNRLFIDFIRRKPVALVKLYRYFKVDEEGVLFDSEGDSGESELPVIVGLETKIFGPKQGTKYQLEGVSLSLNIIKEVRENRAFKNYKINKIDVANPDNTSFFVALSAVGSGYPVGQPVKKQDSLEVKIGQENIKNKIILLAGIISQEKDALSNIKYIDLRFKEPVIKLKNVK